jgi:hypothetical protein
MFKTADLFNETSTTFDAPTSTCHQVNLLRLGTNRLALPGFLIANLSFAGKANLASMDAMSIKKTQEGLLTFLRLAPQKKRQYFLHRVYLIARSIGGA